MDLAFVPAKGIMHGYVCQNEPIQLTVGNNNDRPNHSSPQTSKQHTSDNAYSQVNLGSSSSSNFKEGQPDVVLALNSENYLNCSFCSLKFKDTTSLKFHIRIHTGEKPYQCKECIAKFTSHSKLVVHSRIHTGERPFMCNLCGNSFTQVAHLRTHMTAHSEEKKYSCNKCSKKFKYEHSLREHEKQHSLKAEFSCHLCQKEFFIEKRLKTHISRVHENDSVHECDVCKKRFKSALYVVTHKERFCGNNGYHKRWKNSVKRKPSGKNKKQLKAQNQIPKVPLPKGRPKGSLGKKKRRGRKKSSHLSKLQIVTDIPKQNNNNENTPDKHLSNNSTNESIHHQSSSIIKEVPEKLIKPSGSAASNQNVSSQSNSTSVLQGKLAALEEVIQKQSKTSCLETISCPLPTPQNIESFDKEIIPENIKCLPPVALQKIAALSSNFSIYDCTNNNSISPAPDQAQKTVNSCNIINKVQQYSKSNVSSDASTTVSCHNLVIQDRQFHKPEYLHTSNQMHGKNLQNSMDVSTGTECINQKQMSNYQPIRNIDNNHGLNNMLALENNSIFSNEQHLPQQYNYQSIQGLSQSGMDQSTLLNYGYGDNFKDIFNLSALQGTYDSSLLVNAQDNAQNLSMSHDLPVQDNLENLPQNLTTIHQNLSDLQQNLPSMSPNIPLPENLAMTHNIGTPTQNITPSSQSHIPINFSSMNHLPSFVSNVSYSQNINIPNSNTISHNYSRIVHSGNSADNMSQDNMSHNGGNSLFSNIVSVPENLSSSARENTSHPQNLSHAVSGAGSLSGVLQDHTVNQKSNLSSHRYAPLYNFNMISQDISSNSNINSIPQNLSIQNHSFMNTLSDDSQNLGLVYDLSISQAHSSNLNELSVSITEEVLQPQNLSQNHMSQPENLSMPQNLSSTSNSDRSGDCLTQPQNLSVHATNISHDMSQKNMTVPQNLSCDAVHTPQNLSYNHHSSAMMQNMQTNHMSNRSLDTCLPMNRQSACLNLSANDMSHHSSVHYTQQTYNQPHASNQVVNTYSTDMSYGHPLPSSANVSNNTCNQKHAIPENLSNSSKLQTCTIHDLSYHSKVDQSLHQNTPENLSVGSNIESQPQNLSLTLQPQNLSHNNKDNSSYTNDQMNPQSFVIPQPQNLSLPHSWNKYDHSVLH